MTFPRPVLVGLPLSIVASAALPRAKHGSGGAGGALRRTPLLEKAGPAPKAEKTSGNTTRKIVARFDDADEARKKAEELAARGADVRALDAEGRILSIEATEPSLEGVTVPDSTLAAPNATFSVVGPERLPSGARFRGLGGRGGRGSERRGGPASNGSTDYGFDPRVPGSGSAGDANTVADVVGLTALRARVEGADGRGMRVAVLDTGIDFAIPGLSRTRNDEKGKLAGFYDLTPFGRVSLSKSECESPTKGCAVSGGTDVASLRFASSFAGVEVTSTGVLSERAPRSWARRRA